MSNLTRYNKFYQIKKEANTNIWSYQENDSIIYKHFITLDSDNYSQEVENFINIQKYIYEEKEFIDRYESYININYINSIDKLRESLEEILKREKIYTPCSTTENIFYIDVEAIDAKEIKKILLEKEKEIIKNYSLHISFLVKKQNYKKYFLEFEELCPIFTVNLYKNYIEYILDLDECLDEYFYHKFNEEKCSEILKKYMSYNVKIPN